MSIGGSIFLSALLISTIYLGQKLSKHIWLKIIKILSFFILGVPLIIWLCIQGYNKYEKRPKKITEYWGIKLGDTAEEVRFLKGNPTSHFVESKWEKYKVVKQHPADKKEIPMHITKTSNLGIFWIYKDDNKLIQVEFTNDKVVKSIDCICTKDYCTYSCPAIFSIDIGSKYTDIISIFGEPPHQDSEYGERILRYPQYNVIFELKKNEVFKLGIFKD